MKIVIPGGSGQVGAVLARAFQRDGHQVTIISRQSASSACRSITWDGRTLGPWTGEIDEADVVINLAGRSVNCRYHRLHREQMMNSRVDSTRVIGQAIAQCKNPPRVWLQASTATIYAHRLDAPNDEITGIIGGNEPDAPSAWRFSIEVARAWERACDEAVTPHTRKVKLRSAMTMSPDRGGIFDVLLGLVRRGLGGTCGNGRQYVSWVHEEDFVRAVYFLIERSDLEGAINICSPHPLPNADFMRALRQAWGTRIGLPATGWMLGIGAFFLRTETELILKSRRVIPTRLPKAGFQFNHAEWSDAAQRLVAQWRSARR